MRVDGQRLPSEVEAIIAASVIVRIATVTPRGAPHAAPFWFWYDGERIVLDTVENQTVRNLRANPRASALFDLGERFPDPLRGAMVTGRTTLHDPERAPAPVAAAVEALRQAHADEIETPEFAEYLEHEQRPVVFVELVPERVNSWNLRAM